MATSPARSWILLGSFAPMIWVLAAPQSPKPAPPKPKGESLFAKSCAPCHGPQGKGGPAFPKPLVGTKSVGELSKFVAKSMPPGQGTPPAQAKLIAAYMHERFYSPLAQERNRPPRRELARLTVRQFRNAVADLLSEGGPTVPAGEPGLKGTYYKNREFWDQKQLAFARTDPGVRLDFGPKAPQEGMDPYAFSAVWTGSVLAPDTGEYEFVVRTDQAAKLFLNGEEKPLVDGWVRSGDETEYRGAKWLLGGRAYSVRLEFSKATQGVDEKKKPDKPPAKAFVQLLWRRPKRVAEPIPPHLLRTGEAESVYVAETPFPADDRSIGYERGVKADKAWEDAVAVAALEAAAMFAEDVPGKPEEVRDKAAEFVRRAFRRPLDKETEARFIDKQLADVPPALGLKRVALLTLLSPRFLYRELGLKGDPYTIAANLSFGLWDTIPDPALQEAAEKGELKTRAQVEAQAARMVLDPRAKAKLRDFLLLWLRVDEIPDVVKSPKRYPQFSDSVAADLRTSLELFLDANGGNYARLMTAPVQYVNGRLSKLYGGDLPPDAPFQKVAASDRAGVLTQPYLMARYAYLEGSSPIHRGVLVARNMLGRVLAPPPAAFTPLAASLHPNLTTRQRVALQTKPKMCASCHDTINPLGFTFERYDAIGRLRQKDGAQPVDATGSYVTRSGAVVRFQDARDLARFIAASEEGQSAFVEKLLQNLVRQPARAYGPGTVSALRGSFAQGGYDTKRLMVKIMGATAGAP